MEVNADELVIDRFDRLHDVTLLIVFGGLRENDLHFRLHRPVLRDERIAVVPRPLVAEFRLERRIVGHLPTLGDQRVGFVLRRTEDRQLVEDGCARMPRAGLARIPRVEVSVCRVRSDRIEHPEFATGSVVIRRLTAETTRE